MTHQYLFCDTGYGSNLNPPRGKPRGMRSLSRFNWCLSHNSSDIEVKHDFANVQSYQFHAACGYRISTACKNHVCYYRDDANRHLKTNTAEAKIFTRHSNSLKNQPEDPRLNTSRGRPGITELLESVWD